MLHVVTSSANIFFAPLEKGRLPRLDFEAMTGAEPLGIRTPHDMTWKQLLDLDACTECGRCQDVCPAWAEQKPLSPKRLVLDLIAALQTIPVSAPRSRSRRRPTVLEKYLGTVSGPRDLSTNKAYRRAWGKPAARPT